MSENQWRLTITSSNDSIDVFSLNGQLLTRIYSHEPPGKHTEAIARKLMLSEAQARELNDAIFEEFARMNS